MSETATNQAFFDRAGEIIPGGVNSPVRAFRSVGRTPVFAAKAEGSRIWDVEGREYIDLIGSWGPMIAGHAHPAVVEAISRAAQSGTSYGLSHPAEAEIALEIRRRMPSIEQIRFVNSGTEAAMSAARLARAFTGRSKIVKFSGCYHGHVDSFLVAAGSGVATLNLPDSPGVTRGAAGDTLVVRNFNDPGEAAGLFDLFGDDIAALIVEPIPGNMGVVPPEAGFLEVLREFCDRSGALLIFDEVISGFRAGYGGAQGLYGVEPDLTLLGKIIGGGLPVGAFGGRREIMQMLAPVGPVYQAGTLSGNPVALAAGMATLKLLTPEGYDRLETLGLKLEAGVEGALNKKGIRGIVQRSGSLMTLFFGSDRIRNFAEASAADHAAYSRFFGKMLDAGILLPPSGYEAWFLSLAHTEEDVAEIIEAVESAI